MFFVTGSTGFIGKQLVDKIEGEIRVLSREPHPQYETIICDLASDMIPRASIDGVDTIFHLAGVAHDKRDASKIESHYRAVNVDATVRLAELAVASGVKRFIFVSSVKAGGPAVVGHCMTEVDQREPEDIYGKTKREAEVRLLEIDHLSGMHVSIVRPSLVYGPGVKGNLRLMQAGIKKGWFPPLPEVNNRRSMIHVDNLVKALILVSEDDRTNGEIYIATDDQPYSSREIYEASCAIMGKPVPKWHLPRIAFDILSHLSPRLRYKVGKLFDDECYSSKKLQSLGFNPQRSLRD